MTQALRTQADIMREMRHVLIDTFEVTEQDIQPNADLFADLGLDSIDAVDLVILFGQKLGKQIDQDSFKTIRTVQEAVEALHALVVDG